MCQCWWSSSLNNTVKSCMLNCCRNLWASIFNTQHINQWGLLQTVLALAQQTTFENCTKALNKSCSSQNQTISLSIASSYCWVCPSPLSVASYPGSFPKSLGTRLPWVHLALSITHVQYHPPSLFHTHTVKTSDRFLWTQPPTFDMTSYYNVYTCIPPAAHSKEVYFWLL